MSFAEEELARTEEEIKNLNLRVKRYQLGMRSAEYQDVERLMDHRSRLKLEIDEEKRKEARKKGTQAGHYVQIIF